MSATPPDNTKSRYPWWRTGGPALLVVAVFVLGLVLAKPLIAIVSRGVWWIALLALSAWLIAPDALWAWREHPEVVRRAMTFITHPRTIRVLLYLLLAYAWWVTMF